jgi:hypothetical protein
MTTASAPASAATWARARALGVCASYSVPPWKIATVASHPEARAEETARAMACIPAES